jgi:hypothetical protein
LGYLVVDCLPPSSHPLTIVLSSIKKLRMYAYTTDRFWFEVSEDFFHADFLENDKAYARVLDVLGHHKSGRSNLQGRCLILALFSLDRGNWERVLPTPRT